MQEGKNVPASKQEKKYGHLWVDGTDYGNSEELYNAFAQYARGQALNQGQFYDQWLTALRNGQDIVFGNGNTVNMVPDDMSERRAGKRSNWTKFWDDTFNTRRNQFSDAIATARRFTFVPTTVSPKSKSEFDTSEIILNYNDDPKKKGHKIWSVGHADNQRAIQRVADALAGLKDPDSSDYIFNDSLKAAYQIAQKSGMTPEEYANALWNRLQDNKWVGYKDPENDNDLDWLKAFGIGIGPYETSTSTVPLNTTPTVTTPTENVTEQTVPQTQTAENEKSAEAGNTQEPQLSQIDASINNTPKHRTKYELEQSAPDTEGWITYTIPFIGDYQYNTNNNIATGRIGEQARAERKSDKTLSFIAKPIGEAPLVYNGIDYPIVQEKDTNNYYALQNNMRIKLDQDFVNKWLEGKLSEQDYTKLQSKTGKYTNFVKSDGERINWLLNFFKNIGAGLKVGIEQREDNINKNKKPKETREQFKARRQQEAYLRSIAAGGSKDPNKNRFAPKQEFGGIVKALNGTRFGDPNYDSSPAWVGLINSGLQALDYGSMAWGRKDVHDRVKKGLNDSLYKKVTPLLQGITTATPIEDANVDRYDQYAQRGLTTPLVSDNVINTQNVLTLQANALQGREQAVRQQSNAALQRQMQNQQITNQQSTIDAEAENDFRARLAGLKMNLAQNDASWTAQTAQSIQNLAREWRTKFDEQTSRYNQLAYNQELSAKTKDLENNWLNNIRISNPDIWKKWNAVDKSKYSDFYTWATSENGIWNDNLEKSYKTYYSDPLAKHTLDLYKKYNLSPELKWIYRNREAIYKSGGSLSIKQRNRYKNEPSEDIWINQNKATHKLVAKLNDNIIKTFLKTLK